MTHVRRTSIEAYNEIKESGLLSKRRWQAYEILFHHGPLTANQLVRLAAEKFPALKNTWTFNKRLSELRRAGIVDEIAEVPCPLTGRTAILWDCNDRLPLKMDKPRKVKCRHCEGKGFVIEQQTRLF